MSCYAYGLIREISFKYSWTKASHMMMSMLVTRPAKVAEEMLGWGWGPTSWLVERSTSSDVIYCERDNLWLYLFSLWYGYSKTKLKIVPEKEKTA